MPLVDIELIEGVFDDDQKRRMIHDVTEAMVGVEGEAMRGVTWCGSRKWPVANGPSAASR